MRAYITWGYHHHHSSSCIYLCSNMKCVSRHSRHQKGSNIRAPCWQLVRRITLFRWQSDGLLHTSGITGYLASHSGLLAMASPVAANLQICKEAKGQGQEAQAKGQSHKGRAKRAAALYPPFLYSLSKSKPHQPKVNAYSACNEHITVGTTVSPHGPGATYPVRNRLVAGMFDQFWAGYPNSPAKYIKFCNRLY